MKKYDDKTLAELKGLLNRQENEMLSPLAVRNADGVRRMPDERMESDYRQAFSVDVDRILHSLAYARYIDKTQVFYLVKNDHITHRVLHVQLVSKIARTIGRFLSLNEDLIEAIALGHDIGHTPFGHDGNTFCQRSAEATASDTFITTCKVFIFWKKWSAKEKAGICAFKPWMVF